MTDDSWKNSANKRRDIRAIKDPNEPKKPAKKKNTKRWCKGKEGVEHQLVCMEKAWFGTTKCKVLACTVCGIEKETWYPISFTSVDSPFFRPKPDWVK